MNAIVKRLAEDADVRFGVRIERLVRMQSGWKLIDEDGEERAPFERVVIALPPEQTLSLLEHARSPLVEQVHPVRSDSCWAVLAAFDTRLPIEFDGAFVEGSPIAWAARDSSKPERTAGERWVLHGTAHWSAIHIEDDGRPVAEKLLRSFLEATGVAPVAPEFLKAHRWRFAKVEAPLSEGCLWDSETGLGVCGDWCHRCRVEGAFLSGLAMAKQISTDPVARTG